MSAVVSELVATMDSKAPLAVSAEVDVLRDSSALVIAPKPEISASYSACYCSSMRLCSELDSCGIGSSCCGGVSGIFY